MRGPGHACTAPALGTTLGRKSQARLARDGVGDAVLPSTHGAWPGACMYGSSSRTYAWPRKRSPTSAGSVAWETQCSESLP
ncbi:hypothetical protein [Paenibacillus lautus]|uniref:hypothetical protein n=1 Tax=Paenibacillus lautus TaxID=1401 RepID=UPI00398860A0